MTSQPGTTGPGTTGPGTTGDTGIPDPGPSVGSGPSWPLVLPLTLLVILGLAGLRGAVTAPRWNGPLRHDGLVIGLVLEAILAVLLVLTARRRSRAMRTPLLGGAPVNDVAAKLRGGLVVVLGAGMIAVAVAIFVSLHLHLGARVQPAPTVGLKPIPKRTLPPQGAQPGSGFHVPLTVILYVLLVVLLVAAVLLCVWWSRRFRPSFGGKTSGFLAEDPEDLREAVESGRLALRTVDDARAAIIACYVAMETSLAERGAARAVADTPDELLARATASGLVRGTAAARLTALFYEARFSSHPLGRGQRDAAEQALDELAAALAAPEEAPEEAPGEAKAVP
jgi:hypothetical protein